MLFKLYENNFWVLRKTVLSEPSKAKNPAPKIKNRSISLKCELIFIFFMYWGFLQPRNRMVMVSGAKNFFFDLLPQDFLEKILLKIGVPPNSKGCKKFIYRSISSKI
jgi:hypothetical protein